MAAQPRGPLPAGIYHVGTRSAGPIEIFHDDLDRSQFCNLLVRRLRGSHWRCLAFCLMPTHYHLLLDVPDDSLQPGMRVLNGRYAVAFNLRHGRRGHLFGDRYFAKPVLTEASLRRRYRYIARNPVKAGLCVSALDWQWSSVRDAVAGSHVFSFVDHEPVRAAFGGALDVMLDFVEDEPVLDMAA